MRQEAEDKILKLYFEFPNKKFTLREIESKTKVPRATAQKYLKMMKNEGLFLSNNPSFFIIFKYFCAVALGTFVFDSISLRVNFLFGNSKYNFNILSSASCLILGT